MTNTKIIEDVRLSRGGGPLGLSIIGGSDHSCVPFGTGEQVPFFKQENIVHRSGIGNFRGEKILNPIINDFIFNSTKVKDYILGLAQKKKV